MKSLTTLHVSPWTVEFQCLRELTKSASKTIGRISSRFCAMSETMYSLFHRKSARSATWKWGEPMHFAMCLNSGLSTSTNSVCWIISRISSTSLRKSTSFGEYVSGQKPRMLSSTCFASFGSFSTNWVTQYESCWWYIPTYRTLCKGSSARIRNCLCSSFSGSAKPLMIEPRISNSSAMPLWRSVS